MTAATASILASSINSAGSTASATCLLDSRILLFFGIGDVQGILQHIGGSIAIRFREVSGSCQCLGDLDLG